jgi:DNA polymerase III epsilon subunit-like protein
MIKKFVDLRFAVIDVEGNGQQPPEIIEIAIEQIEGLSLSREPQVWLVKPERPIAPIVTRKVHGIRNADVADAPRWPDVAPDVAAALADRIPVAHNARVEYDVLRRHLPDWSPATVLDTLRLARAVWPGLGTYGLDRLLDHAGILLREESGRRHRAGFDVHATAPLFLTLVKTAGSCDQVFALASLPGVSSPDDQRRLW